MPRKATQKKIKNRKKTLKKGVGLGPVPFERQINKTEKMLKKHLKNGVISQEFYDCVVSNKEIKNIVFSSLEVSRIMEADEIFRFLLLNSECDFRKDLTVRLKDIFKKEVGNKINECLEQNEDIENLVDRAMRLNWNYNPSELSKIIITDSECFDS